MSDKTMSDKNMSEINFVKLDINQYSEIKGLEGFCAVELEGEIYIAGGSIKNDKSKEIKTTNRVFRLTENEQGDYTIEEISSMVECRECFGLIVYEEKFYAFGGKNNGHGSSTIEMYEPLLNKWTLLENKMLLNRYDFGYTVMNSKLYVSGGSTQFEQSLTKKKLISNLDNLEEGEYSSYFDKEINGQTIKYFYTIKDFKNTTNKIKVNGSTYLDTVEEFSFVSNTWKNHSYMFESRAHHQMTHLDGSLYVLGGKILETEFEHISEENKGFVKSTETVEKFTNETQEWNFTIKLYNRRTNFGLISGNYSFIIFGGETLGWGYGKTQTIEVYFPNIGSRKLENNFVYSKNSIYIEMKDKFILLE